MTPLTNHAKPYHTNQHWNSLLLAWKPAPRTMSLGKHWGTHVRPCPSRLEIAPAAWHGESPIIPIGSYWILLALLDHIGSYWILLVYMGQDLIPPPKSKEENPERSWTSSPLQLGPAMLWLVSGFCSSSVGFPRSLTRMVLRDSTWFDSHTAKGKI